jgi:hypothetical protein
MTPIKKWKKWLAVGCSHGAEIDPEARKAVLIFKERWKPDKTLHLGDFIDLSAFRAGAVRDSNAADVAGDLSAGIEFLHELRPQHILCGNHEARLWKFSQSPNALLAYAANLTIQKITETANKLRATLTPYGIREYQMLGGTKFVHGSMFNVSAIRDHAETYGSAGNAPATSKAQAATASACSPNLICPMPTSAELRSPGPKASPTATTATHPSPSIYANEKTATRGCSRSN